jgi:transcription elongation factor Elf1
MTDEQIDWEESDDEYTEFESDVRKLSDVLYEFSCKECGKRLTLRLTPDPDDLGYSTECEDCDLGYRINVTHVKAVAYDRSL